MRNGPVSHGPDDGRVALAPLGRTLIVLLSITMGTVGAALPALLLIWLVFALLANGVAAEALEQTGGLEPTTFGGGYWIALGINVAIVLTCVANRLRGAPTPWRPLAYLTIVYMIIIWLLVPLDWNARWDAPDIITTSALLGADMLVTYLLPLILLVLLISSIKHAWLRSKASALAADRVIALSACLGLVGFSLTTALFAAGARGYLAKFTPDGDELDSMETHGVESERQAYAELAADIGPPAPARYRHADSKFQQCAAELARSRQSRGSSPVQDAIRRLIRQGMSKHDAEDITMSTLMWVCLQKPTIDELVPYFWTSVCDNSKELYRNNSYCSLDAVSDCVCDTESALDTVARKRYLELLREAYKELKPAERQLLDSRYLLELDYDELADRLEISEAAARQRVKRALDHLREIFEPLSLSAPD